MINFIFKTINILLQSLMTLYIIIFLCKILEDKKYGNINIIIVSILTLFASIITNVIDMPITLIKTLISAAITFINLKFILKISVIKTLFIIFCTIILSAITELFSMFIINLIFNCNDIFEILNSPLRLLLLITLQFIFVILITKILLYILSKFTKLKELYANTSQNIFLNICILIAFCILPKVLISALNVYQYPSEFLFIELIQTIIISVVIFIFFKRTLERDKAQSELNLSEMHNKTMVGMVDGVRTLKHDYNNIIQALSGYVKTKQYDKLEEHINKVLQECNVVNNYSMITTETFNEPAVYGIMGAKYFIAVDKDITVDLDVSCDFTKISFPMPEFSRILGILLDNAIEATQKSSNKYIRFEARYDTRKNADIIKVINTYDTNINIDLNKIYEKGFSSKKIKSGIGLWEVKKLVKKNKNSQIYATVENEKFVQNLIIERLTNYENCENTNNIENTKNNMLIPLNK